MIRLGKSLKASILPLLGLFFSSHLAHAAVYTGNSAYTRDNTGACSALLQDNGNFNDPKNWGGPCSPGAVPGPGTTADLTGRVIHGSTIKVGTLIVGGGGSLTADSINTNILKMSGGISGSSDSSTLTVNSQFTWTQGSLGGLIIELGPKCATTISGDADGNGNGAKYINHSSVLNNRGVINFSGAGLLQYGAAPGTVNNYGTFKCVADGVIGSDLSGYGVAFVNYGTLTKIGGSGVSSIGAGTGFINNGHLQAKTGILDPSSGYGTSVMNDGTTIDEGAGVVRDSFFWELHGKINMKGTLRLASSGNYGVATFTGPGLLDWRSGGFAADPAKTQITLAADSNCLMSGLDNKVTGASLTSLGTLRWKAGKIDGTLTNKGTFNLLQDGDLGSPNLVNFGTIAKTGGTGEVTLGSHTLTSSGTLDVQKGTLVLGYSQFSHDTFTNGVLKGKGKIVSYTPTNCSGNVEVDTTLQLDAPGHTGSELHGPAALVGTGIVNWQGGVMDKMTIGKDFTVNVLSDTAKNFSGGCSNAGTINWRGGATINFGLNTGESLNNTGTFNVLASGTFGQSTLFNKGTLNTFAGKSTYFGVLNNSGTLNLGTAAAPGILNFTSNDGVGFTNSGTLNAFIATDKVGHFSQVLVSSNNVTSAVLGGTLAIKTAADANLTAASQLPLVSIGSRTSYSGTFGTVTGLPTVGTKTFKLFYNPLDVTLGVPFNLTGRTYRTVGSNIQGISGSTVTLTPVSGAVQTFTTDANGNYAFTGLPVGTYTVTATHEGIVFDTPSKKVAVPVTGGSDALANFATYAASAKVVDVTGAPVAGAEILISGANVSRSVVTDASGIALFSDIGPGTYTLTPQEQGDFTFTPTKGTLKLPTTGVAGQSPNGQVIFTRKAVVDNRIVPAVSGASS